MSNYYYLIIGIKTLNTRLGETYGVRVLEFMKGKAVAEVKVIIF